MGTANDKIARRPKRWSAARKMEVVLRHVKGESLDDLSREIGVSASQIEQWYHKAMNGIEASLKEGEANPLQTDLDLAKKRIGELSMENELLREKSRKQGVFWGGKW
jgi:transposase